MNLKLNKAMIEQIVKALDESEYFWDDLDVVMITYRFHPTKGFEFFSPEPTLLEVAGKYGEDQDRELLGFYGSLSKLIEDVAENGSYEQWRNSFTAFTYGSFISLLSASHLISEQSVIEIKEGVEQGCFTRVGDFINRLTHDMEQSIVETHQLTA